MKFKKVLKYLLIIFVVLLVISGIIFQRSGRMIYGGLTERVNHEQFAPQTGPVSITNVNVLSEDGEHFISNQTVVLEDGLIKSIDSSEIDLSEYRMIDGTGKYLIPGLVDAHVHLFQSPNDLLLYVANGVTQVRELIGEPTHLKWKAEIENGRVGPKMFVATPRLGSFETMEGLFMETTQGFINVKNSEEARKTIKVLHQKGYDGVKIYSQLNKESYLAIAETAKSLGMPIFGHIPWSVTYEDIFENGQSGIAHFEEVMNALNREFGENEFGNFYGREEEFFKYINDRSDELADNLIKHDITITSTLWLTESFVRQKFELEQVLSEVALEYQNPGISEWSKYIPGGLGWLPDVNRYKMNEGMTPERMISHRKYWTAYGQACALLAKNLSERGVKIMAGTDANLPPTVPGFSLHDELQSLNEAGLSPVEVLKSATSTPANWLESNAGKIATGYDANLVLLNKNPLEDISNTKAIQTVIVEGRVFNRALLDQILESVRDANDRSRKVDISRFIQ